ncbi:MAG TPA: tyrosinase family protein [bacterium]|nr:tyrosinase family protein [bacterium]
MIDRRSFLKRSSALLLSFAATGCNTSGSRSAPTPQNPRVRRSVKTLSASERQQYVDAVLALKSTQSPFDPSLSYYDQLVAFHREAVRYGRVHLGYAVAHETPAFLPWHRKLMLLIEDAIRELAFPDFTLPYWDWTDPESLDIIFTTDFMGPLIGDSSDNYAVNAGPFRKGEFPLGITPIPLGDTDAGSQCPFTFLTRGPKTIPLPTAEEVADMMALTRYSAPPYDNSIDYALSFNNTMLGIPNEEGMDPFLHSAVHTYVGGTWEGTYYDPGFNQHDITYQGSMTVLDASPNDPVFFLHHCNVDRLWAEWERVNGNIYEPESGYNLYFNLDDQFYPFLQFADNPRMASYGMTPGSMLDIEPLGFTYDTLLS